MVAMTSLTDEDDAVDDVVGDVLTSQPVVAVHVATDVPQDHAVVAVHVAADEPQDHVQGRMVDVRIYILTVAMTSLAGDDDTGDDAVGDALTSEPVVAVHVAADEPQDHVQGRMVYVRIYILTVAMTSLAGDDDTGDDAVGDALTSEPVVAVHVAADEPQDHVQGRMVYSTSRQMNPRITYSGRMVCVHIYILTVAMTSLAGDDDTGDDAVGDAPTSQAVVAVHVAADEPQDHVQRADGLCAYIYILTVAMTSLAGDDDTGDDAVGDAPTSQAVVAVHVAADEPQDHVQRADGLCAYIYILTVAMTSLAGDDDTGDDAVGDALTSQAVVAVHVAADVPQDHSAREITRGLQTKWRTRNFLSVTGETALSVSEKNKAVPGSHTGRNSLMDYKQHGDRKGEGGTSCRLPRCGAVKPSENKPVDYKQHGARNSEGTGLPVPHGESGCQSV
ncbi:hypothetical protein NN561_019941 [Cricetulus griseus]